MNFKTTYILFGILLAVLILFFVSQRYGTRTAETAAYVLPSLQDSVNPVPDADIDRVQIQRRRPTEENLVFYRNEQGNWYLKEPHVRIDTTQINRVIDEVKNARKEEQADLTPDLKRFGLDTPAEVVTLFRKGSDQEWRLNVGETSSGGDQAVVYVTSSDESRTPMAVRRSSLEMLFKGLNDFRTKWLLADTAFDIQSVELQEPNKQAVALEKTGEGRWKFVKPAYGEADYEGEPQPAGQPATTPQHITGVQELLRAVADIKVESDQDFGKTNDSDADLAAKGLELGKERLRITAKRQPASFGTEQKKEPVQDSLLIGKPADKKGDKFYARLESERNVVLVPAKKVEPVLQVFADPAVLRNRDLVELDTARVDAIDVKPADHSLVKLRKEGEPGSWKLFEAGKPQEADSAVVQGLLTALTAKRQIKEFVEAARTDAQLGFDHPASVVSVWMEGINKEAKKEEKKEEKPSEAKKEEAGKKEQKKGAKAEPAKKETKKPAETEPALKDSKPTVRLVFGKREKDLVYVRREVGNEITRVAVPASLLDRASEGKLAYLSRKLPTFASDSDVSRLVLVRDSQSFELDRAKGEKTPAAWKFQQPKDLAGRTADAAKVDRVLEELRNLQAEKLVAEKPTAADLERFGLKTPVVRATVTTTRDKKSEDFVYRFGRETDDKLGVYAQEGGRDLVFVVRKDVLNTLETSLREQTVFTFSLDKVKGLKLTGWQDIVGNPLTLDLQRQSAQQWTVKGPGDFKVDGAKVEGFVSGLTQLKALRFLGKTGPKPEYKLGLQEGALEVVIMLQGEKEPYTLTIGGPSGSDGYYATSNKLPGEVFVLPKANFEQAKSRPAYFRKE